MQRLIMIGMLILFPLSVFTADEYRSFKASSKITFRLRSLSSEKNGTDHPSKKFKPGDKIWMNLEVSGLLHNESGEFDLQADCQVSAEGMKGILVKADILNQKLAAEGQNLVNLNFWVQTYEDFKPGRYSILIMLRDRVAKKFNKFSINFLLDR